MNINPHVSLAVVGVTASLIAGCGNETLTHSNSQQEGPQIESVCNSSGACTAYVKGVSVTAARDSDILRRIRKEIKPFRTCPDDRIAAREVTGGIIIYIVPDVQTNLGNLRLPK